MSATTVPSVPVPVSEAGHGPTTTQVPPSAVKPTNAVASANPVRKAKPATTADGATLISTTATPPVTAARRTTARHHDAEPTAARDWQDLIARVREAGQYPTAAEAERITRIVLSALGGHVVGDERVDLARALPREAARMVADRIPATRGLTAPEFVDSVAAHIEGATRATARWDVSSVLSVLPPLLGDTLTTRILAQLPPGYALLFGRADLGRATA